MKARARASRGTSRGLQGGIAASLAFAALAFAACAGGPAGPAGPGMVQAPTSAVEAGAAAASDPAIASSAPEAGVSTTDAGGRLCGCKLCEPVFSDDTCSTDADCAAESPCHAQRCVGKAHGNPRKAGDMCTEIMMCGTIDANACGCVKGKCALYPRP